MKNNIIKNTLHIILLSSLFLAGNMSAAFSEEVKVVVETDGAGTGTETDGTGTETDGTGTETGGAGTETDGTGTGTDGTGTETGGTGTGTGTETGGAGTETDGTGTETDGTGTGTGTETGGTEVEIKPEGEVGFIDKAGDLISNSADKVVDFFTDTGAMFTGDNGLSIGTFDIPDALIGAGVIGLALGAIIMLGGFILNKIIGRKTPQSSLDEPENKAYVKNNQNAMLVNRANDLPGVNNSRTIY